MAGPAGYGARVGAGQVSTADPDLDHRPPASRVPLRADGDVDGPTGCSLAHDPDHLGAPGVPAHPLTGEWSDRAVQPGAERAGDGGRQFDRRDPVADGPREPPQP